jgi:hypothetical protein
MDIDVDGPNHNIVSNFFRAKYVRSAAAKHIMNVFSNERPLAML